MSSKIEAALSLLATSKRNLQLLDEQIATLQEGRRAVEPADDVSSEHRTSWLGVIDDDDSSNGINLGTIGAPGAAENLGWNNPKTGKIRNQQDAAFVCTNIMLAVRLGDLSPAADNISENANFISFSGDPLVMPMLRLTDGNTGRNLVTGLTTGTLAVGQTSAPVDLDRGAVPFSYLSSIRPGFGADVRNKLFSEFTIPRSGVVSVEVFNLGIELGVTTNSFARVYVTLFGYKVFGA